MTANLTVHVTSAEQAAATATNYVTGAGGYTAGEQAQLSPSPRQRQTVSMTLKVPQAGYGAALSQLSRPGQDGLAAAAVHRRHPAGGRRGQPRHLRAGRDRLAPGAAQAGRDVSGLLQVQQQISSDESSLEALQAQQRALDRETSYATISLLLLGPKPHAVVHHRQHAGHRGFAGGLASGWRGLGHATTWVLTVLGAVLPFAAAVVVLGGAGYLLWRRFARRRAAPTPASES